MFLACHKPTPEQVLPTVPALDAGARIDGGNALAPSPGSDDGCSVVRGRFDGAWLAVGLTLMLRRKRRPSYAAS
jgi:hypothetical protein